MDVCVVGAGPSGLMAALVLKKLGVDLRIIELLKEPSHYSRALVVHSRTLELLELLGVADLFIKEGRPLEKICYHLGDQEIVIHPHSTETPYSYFLLIPQDHTEALLVAALRKAGVEVERGVECVGVTQDANGVTLTLKEGAPIEAKWVIAADGGHSRMRHILGVSFAGETLPQHFALADVHVAGELAADAIHFFFSEKGASGLFPIRPDLWRVVLADVPEPAPTVNAPSLEDIQQLLSEKTKRDWSLSGPEWLAYFAINSRQVAHYQVGRVFLVGDAAHVHSPIGGQGMNTGLQDAFNLAWKLAGVIDGQFPTTFLQSYEEERLPVAHSLVSVTDTLTRALTSKAVGMDWVRNKAIPFALNREFVQRFLWRKISETEIAYNDSSVVEDVSALLSAGPRAGERVPYGPIYDLLQKHFGKHLLLLFCDRQPVEKLKPFLSLIKRRMLADYGGRIIPCVISAESCTLEECFESIVDSTRTIHKQWKVGVEPALYLVRPDAYLAFSSKPINQEAFLNYLGRFFMAGARTATI